MDIEKRRYELQELWNNQKTTYSNFFDEVIKQEQRLLKQEKKAAILEFGQRLYRRVVQQALYLPDEYNQLFKDDINNLLTQYGIEEKV